MEQTTYNITDISSDILSHPKRNDRIHILTLDHILAEDIYSRIRSDERTKHIQLIRPQQTSDVDVILTEIETMAQDTVSSRLLIFDTRRVSMPKLQRAYNAIIGYNRRDLNKLCYTILIGDGPPDLFLDGKTLDDFVPLLARNRVDFHPAVFFYDPFLHYEPDEIELSIIGEKFTLPDKIPKRLIPFFRQDQDIRVDKIRSYFRAIGKDDEVRKTRLRRLMDLYKKSLLEQFPNHADKLKALLSKKGLRLASEKMNLYPLFFEDWVYKLMKRAKRT